MLIIYQEVEQFISELDSATQAKISRMIELLEHYHYRLGMPYSKMLDRNLFELRVTGKKAVRIMYTFRNENIILFYGFVKKSQEISKKELRTIYKKFIQMTT